MGQLTISMAIFNTYVELRRVIFHDCGVSPFFFDISESIRGVDLWNFRDLPSYIFQRFQEMLASLPETFAVWVIATIQKQMVCRLKGKEMMWQEPVLGSERAKERLGYSYSLFKSKWGASWSYLELPNHLIGGYV